MRPRVDAYDLLLVPLSNLPGLTEAGPERRTRSNRYNARPAGLAAEICAAYRWPDSLSDKEILLRLPALKLQRVHNTPGVLCDQAQESI